MKMLRALVLMMAAGCAARSYAQALPTATGPGSYIAVGGGASAFQVDYGQRVLGGAFVFVDAHATSRFLGLEAEGRWLRYHTDEDVTQSTYLVGPHVYLMHGPVKPYVKLLAGVGEMQFPFKYATGSYLAIAGGAGVDVRLSTHWAVRLLDVEYQSWPQFTYGNLKPYGVSAGILFRLTEKDDRPRK